MVPKAVAAILTEEMKIPTIGIGAGNGCDGQILVTDDLLGKFTDFQPRFVRRYANLADVCTDAIVSYANDVKSKQFPDDSESFAISEEEELELRQLIAADMELKGELTC
jgi:3-methyl-2-oxobutanoate hydroxymethyltransferase